MLTRAEYLHNVPERCHLTVPNVADRSLYSTFRVNLVRLLLAASWASLAWLTVTLYRNGRLEEFGTWLPLIGLVLALAVLTGLPWRRVLRRPTSDALFVLWAAAAMAAMVFSQVKGGGSPLVLVYALVIVIGAALLLAPLYLAVVAALSMLAYVLAATRTSSDISQSELVSQLVALMLVGLVTILLAYGLRRQIVDASNRLTLLDRRDDEVRLRERQLEQMYAVSRTIGAGSNLAEVIPELVGRVVGVLNAKSGVVLLYKPKEQLLEVLSPIWVAGQPLRAEGHTLPLTESSLAQQVFTSGEPTLANDLVSREARDSLLIDLDAQQVAAVPLQVESRRIGVLLIADKNAGAFDRVDLSTLEALAAPAALVL
ncbi:MAG: GAF domain-containing protein, partial [Acidimicrobiia bacterium]|nr:GAF domain-containing protein [Acidimicrobiia bacterium]